MIESISANNGASSITPKGSNVKNAAPNQTAAEAPVADNATRQQEPDATKVSANERMDKVDNHIVASDSVAGNSLSIQRNQDVNRYVYRGMNPSTNKVERQWPTEEALRQMTVFREMIGRVVDEAS